MCKGSPILQDNKMTIFKRLFNDLFAQTDVVADDESEILIDERIKPTASFIEDYHKWLEDGLHIGLLDHLKEQYALRISNPDAQLNFHLHDSNGSSGFYFAEESPWQREDYHRIVHYFNQILIEEGYRQNNSRRKAETIDGKLTQIDRFYFKLPLSSRKEVPYPQSWGNIIIEHKLLEEQTLFVKVMANTYNDRSYQDAKDFNSLIHRILSY